KSGMEVLEAAKQIDSDIIVIMFTAYASYQMALESGQKGAFDYLPKPFTAAQLRSVVERGLKQRQLATENRNLRQQLEERYCFDKIIGNSDAILKTLETAEKVTKTDASVLITGESGTGKELIARSLHANSQRKSKPFVPVDCASLPEELLESELFGHEKGAFTSAITTKRGLFEIADGGTLFLDEVGDLPLPIQSKLLRVLQEREFRRVGGTKLLNVDVRIISATNKDLRREIDKGSFREELYYRLNVLSIHLPPLRERRGDVPLLAKHFLQRVKQSNPKPITGILPAAMELLERHSWPGNVRELQNVIERAVSLAEGTVIEPEELPEYIRSPKKGALRLSYKSDSFKEAKEEIIEAFEKDYLINLLRRHDNNISQAAKTAGINRKTIHRLIQKYKLNAVNEYES
ncbi:MAG: sigma-54-dependent transcriptional regulator, partial [Candidatus Poribacteria bacterium]